jgi:hypothetical protein
LPSGRNTGRCGCGLVVLFEEAVVMLVAAVGLDWPR